MTWSWRKQKFKKFAPILATTLKSLSKSEIGYLEQPGKITLSIPGALGQELGQELGLELGLEKKVYCGNERRQDWTWART